MSSLVKNVFIVGSRGIPGHYGGYETFVDKLTEYHKNHNNIKYHVACKNAKEEFVYHNARCFGIKVPNIGPAQAIYYDVLALKKCCQYIQKHKIEKPIIYILACRIGPFIKYFQTQIHKLGGQVFVNPDGHEWLRAKWPLLVRKYWKISEQLMVKHSDLLICDSKNIEKYIRETYAKYSPNTTYIAYGAETKKNTLLDDDKKIVNWYNKHRLTKKEYYLVVGRFVPENNFETMIREFMKSNTKKDLVLITNVNKRFLNQLKKKTHFETDARIKFVGTVYDQGLLRKIREDAFAYLHGHEVGGTNPSLLEALGSTDLNLLLDVKFNREVAEEGALYWSHQSDSLKKMIEAIDVIDYETTAQLGSKARKRVKEAYTWNKICEEYEVVWMRI